MVDERIQHLELIAASLTQAYFAQHTSAARDYRELMDTYDYLLEALKEKDHLPAGHSPLTASDTLANPVTWPSRE